MENDFKSAEKERVRKAVDSLAYEQKNLEERLKEIKKEKELVKKGKPTFSHRQ
jgi:hypothetical protein